MFELRDAKSGWCQEILISRLRDRHSEHVDRLSECKMSYLYTPRMSNRTAGLAHVVEQAGTVTKVPPFSRSEIRGTGGDFHFCPRDRVLHKNKA